MSNGKKNEGTVYHFNRGVTDGFERRAVSMVSTRSQNEREPLKGDTTVERFLDGRMGSLDERRQRDVSKTDG